MTTGIVQEQNLEKHIEKQMGCMAGFLQIFDRHQILTGKRLYTTKRLPSSPAVVSSNASPEKSSNASPEISQELEKQPLIKSTPSPDRLKQYSPVSELRSPSPEIRTPSSESPYPKSPLPLPVFEFKEGTRSSWKFSRDMPRLSLDSRATVDAKGSLYPKEIRTNAAILSANRSVNSGDVSGDGDKNHRSPSVIARLMGLEPLPQSDPEPIKLRRSASESRVNRDLYQPRFVDNHNFQARQSQQPNLKSNISGNVAKEDRSSNVRQVDPKSYNVKAQNRGMGHRKSFFDSADFFPEPKQTISVYGEIEKRLRMRGIDEPSKDLETLKQILEALQLKGLLHTRKSSPQINSRNFVYDRFSPSESPIVVMRPSRSPSSSNRAARFGNESPPSSFRSRPGVRRNANPAGETFPAVSPRRDRPENVRSQSRGRNPSPPSRGENGVRSPSRRGPLVIETQRKGSSDSVEHRRVSPVHSPKVSSRRPVSDQTATNRSPRIKKPTAEMIPKEEKFMTHRAEDDSSTMSESSISTCSQADTEKWKAEENKEGRSLLERCDKLLHSIAELQPSPVSVLDSSFYKEESSPSPVMKRSIDFKVEMEDMWGQAICGNESESDDCDFVYVSEILRASNYLPEDSDVFFLLLEKQQHLKGKDTSRASTLERRLIFDIINEILDRNRQLPPWKAVSRQTSVPEIWSEFRRIRERDESEDLFEVICGVLKKDLAGDAINGWGDCSVELSDAVLDIERLIFKDLIGETIRDLASFAPNSGKLSALCRKLVF